MRTQNKLQIRSLVSFAGAAIMLTVLTLASCEKEEAPKLIEENTQMEEQITAKDSSEMFIPVLIDEEHCDSTINILKAASTCNFSSPWGQCTAGVRLDKGGYTKGNYVYCGVQWSGNACDWYKNAKAKGYKVGNTPKVGAIVVWPGYSGNPYGHVGVITEYKNGYWYYKAWNDYPNGLGKWSYRKVKEFPNSRKPVAPVGYIYSW